MRSERGDFEAHPPATDDSNEIGPVDFGFLGLKANSYASCGPLLEPLLHDETAVVAAQNGIPWWYFHKLEGPYQGHRIEAVDPDGEVSRVIPPERAIGCVVFAGTELAEPGVVQHLEGTRFSIGEPDGTLSERCRRATLAEMCRQAPTRALVASIMEEALEIADAVGAEPSVSIEQRLGGAEKVGDHKPSTLQDLEAGKPLELAAIVDSVVELADLTGVPAPSLRAVSAASGLLAETLGLR